MFFRNHFFSFFSNQNFFQIIRVSIFQNFFVFFQNFEDSFLIFFQFFQIFTSTMSQNASVSQNLHFFSIVNQFFSLVNRFFQTVSIVELSQTSFQNVSKIFLFRKRQLTNALNFFLSQKQKNSKNCANFENEYD